MNHVHDVNLGVVYRSDESARLREQVFADVAQVDPNDEDDAAGLLVFGICLHGNLRCTAEALNASNVPRSMSTLPRGGHQPPGPTSACSTFSLPRRWRTTWPVAAARTLNVQEGRSSTPNVPLASTSAGSAGSRRRAPGLQTRRPSAA